MVERNLHAVCHRPGLGQGNIQLAISVNSMWIINSPNAENSKQLGCPGDQSYTTRNTLKHHLFHGIFSLQALPLPTSLLLQDPHLRIMSAVINFALRGLQVSTPHLFPVLRAA